MIVNFKEISAMSEPDKKEKGKELKKELMKLYAQIAVGTNPESPGRVRQIRRTLARLKTKKVTEAKK